MGKIKKKALLITTVGGSSEGPMKSVCTFKTASTGSDTKGSL